jgi:hypothetical protein
MRTRINKEKKRKLRIRRLMSETGWGLMIGACLFLPLTVLVADTQKATSYLQTAMSLMLLGAIIDLSKRFV